ncbi:hypothetical protein AALP_AA6G127900 [Arabis alpina]|uniref:NB-ARC domain-containing protein n=1 Tax=Arabis alpina TaxID=50452 RepID=A0A087GNV9_ARAAL|nr:hypothetical protein AALP_AA6G127900 [Arabis alpina]
MDSHRKAYAEILETFQTNDRVILVGEAGLGKTWMAREICEYATNSKEGSFYIALWLNLNKELDETSLYENIASQLSLFPQNEWSDEDDSDEDNNEDTERKNQDLMRLKDQIQKKLERKKLKSNGKKYVLLVLDGEGSVTTEKKVVKDLYLQKFLVRGKDIPLKILLTRRKGEKDATNSDGEIKSYATDENESQNESDGEIPPLAIYESHTQSDGEILSHAMDEPLALPDSDRKMDLPAMDKTDVLRNTLTEEYLRDLLKSMVKGDVLESLKCICGNDIGFLTHCIVEMSMHLPAAIVVLAKSLNCIAGKPPFRLSPKEKDILKFAVRSSFPSVPVFDCVDDDDHTRATSTCNPILRLAYELLETDDTIKTATIDCFWHSLSFYESCGTVYYQELIAHWILEGYFDPVRSVTKAYEDGHAILMELINRGFLKIQEDNVVMPEVAMKNLTDLRRRGLLGRSRIGLAKVCGTDMAKRFGKITHGDDMIEAMRATRKGEKITTVLVSGDRLRRVTPEKYFTKLGDLEVLGLFKPTLDPFVPDLLKGAENRAPLKTLFKLRVLVIRDCDLLNCIEELKALQELQALEVSGASSLKKISGDFFTALPKLQSLHLSGLQIESSPHSISRLTELHCLIIKDCPFLKDLPDIQELVKLEVVDISGARGLQTCFDNTPGDKKNHSKNKNFYHLTKLQLLDFSESQIERLPIFQDSAVPEKLHSVTRLLLRDCSKLRRLPSLKPLSGLQILDLSGTSSLVKILEVCFENKKELRSLNLSGTNLSELPTTIEELSNLNVLLLKNCTNLEAIPNITPLANLEVIDVSGSTKLNKIDVSFEEMHYLREVNLSGTKARPPELPKTSKFHDLKLITLADGTCIVGKDWDEVKAKMPSERSEDARSSVESQEISENESEVASSSGGVVRSEIQPIATRTTDCTEKGHVTKERLLQVPLKKIYKKTLSHFNFALQLENREIMEINETNEVDEEALATAEFAFFVECSSTRFISIFNKTKSVKGCWLRMCTDIKDLFSGVDVERLGSLETLSITNLPLLETISCGGSFTNLKDLSIECCPNIITLFREASELPSSLKDLHVEYCEKLVEVSEGVKLSTFTNLKVKNCPKFKENSAGSDWITVDHSETSK